MTRVSEIAATRTLASQLVEDLTGGLSVLVTGPAKSGRSYLAQLVADKLVQLKRNVVVVRGNKLLADRPMAVLSRASAKTVNTDKKAATAQLNQTADSFAALFDRPDSVLIIDDATELDSLSAGVIVDVRTTKRMPLLLVGGPDIVSDEVLTTLVAAAQPGVSITLTGLSFENVAQLSGTILDGIVAADTVSQIAVLSGGLPGVIEDIVRLGQRSGRLVQRDGIWTSNGDLWDNALQFSLLPFLRGLEAYDVKLLTRLAQTEGMTRAQADDIAGTEVVNKLARHAVLRLDCGPSIAGVHVFPPALGEWLRRGPAATGEPVIHDEPAVVTQGRWPVRHIGLESAAIANRIRTTWRNEADQHWARWNLDQTTDSAVPLLHTLFSSGADDDRIATILAKTRRGTNHETLAEFAFLEAGYRAVWQHDLPGALAGLDHVRTAIPGLDARLRDQKTHLTFLCERIPDTAALEPSDGRDPTDLLLVTRVAALIAQGHIGDAAQLMVDLHPVNEQLLMHKQTLEALLLILGDDVEAGVELAVRRLWDAMVRLDAHAIPGYAYAASLGMCMLGRFDELESIVEIAYHLGDSSIFQSCYKAGLFTIGSYVAIWEGRGDYARSLASQATALNIGMGPLPGMFGSRDQPYDISGTTDQFWDRVDELAQRGFLAAALYCAVAAVEIDLSSDRATRLIEQGRDSQSPVLRAFARYIAATVTRDLDAFPGVVADLRQASGPLDATRALVTWALILKDMDDTAGWLKQADAAWRESSCFIRPLAGLFARLNDAINLTIREAEVANLAAQGLSSAEVASRLGLTGRTIEAYLHTVYRKCGVNNRDDLRRITNSWLTLRTDE